MKIAVVLLTIVSVGLVVWVAVVHWRYSKLMKAYAKERARADALDVEAAEMRARDDARRMTDDELGDNVRAVLRGMHSEHE